MATNNSWNNQISGAIADIVLNAGTHAVNIGTDDTTAVVNIGTNGDKTIQIGSVAHNENHILIQSGSGPSAGIEISTNGTNISINSGGGNVFIENDSGTGGVTIGTGDDLSVKTVRIGSIYDVSTTEIRFGSAGTFTLSTDNGVSPIPVMNAYQNGYVNFPSQPAFQAYLSATDSNVTGDATAYQIGSGNALTVVFDQSNTFTTGGVFTAPWTGRYFFGMAALPYGMDASHDTYQLQIVTSNNTFNLAYQNGFVNDAQGGYLGSNGSVFCHMDGGDTCVFKLIVSGGTKVVSVNGGAGFTYVSGYMAM